MKKKFLVSVLLSLGIIVAGVGVAYAAYSLRANQEGYRQSGETQSSRLTMRVEAAMADPNGDFVPDDPNNAANAVGGDLNFTVKNTSNLPIRVTNIYQSSNGCASTSCTGVTSNKNTDGTFATYGSQGSCYPYLTFNGPTSYDNWPTIAPHGTLQVNGTDASRLGAGLVHLASNTPQGCQGANFSMQLAVYASEMTYAPSVLVHP
jgi:hypothetical protein